MDWMALVRGLAGVIIPIVVPGGAVLAPLVVQGIAIAEAAKGKTGTEKLAIAQQVVDTGVAGINAVNVSLGHAPIDAAAVHTIVGEGISTVVDTANALHAQGTVAAAAPPTGLELHTGPADPA